MRVLKYSAFLAVVVSLSLLAGCARAKIENVRTDLKKDAFGPATVIAVKAYNADGALFEGDKIDDARVKGEKAMIKSSFADLVVRELKKKGFNAKLYEGSKDDANVVLQGKVTKFDHGSGALRFIFGFGAGSSNMFIHTLLYKGKPQAVLADFDVIATSGGNANPAGFINAHMEDGAEKTAEYVAEKVRL